MLPLKHRWSRVLLSTVAILILVSVYLFQRWDAATFFTQLTNPNVRFIFNKTARFLLNDFACLLLIAAIFNQSKYLRVGWMLFLLEAAVLLPLYFIVKLSFEGDSEISSPLLSQLHRMIVNPLLMMVLIAGLLYQDFTAQHPKKKSL